MPILAMGMSETDSFLKLDISVYLSFGLCQCLRYSIWQCILRLTSAIINVITFTIYYRKKSVWWFTCKAASVLSCINYNKDSNVGIIMLFALTATHIYIRKKTRCIQFVFDMPNILYGYTVFLVRT